MEIMILFVDTPKGTRAQIEVGFNKIASILGPLTSKTVERGFVSGAKASFAVAWMATHPAIRRCLAIPESRNPS
jgi:hypothetical protein